MIIEAFEEQHRIRQLEKFENEIGLGLRWKFGEASHFMIVVYDAGKGLDIDAVIRDMEKKSVTPEMLIRSNPRIPFYSNDDGIIKAYIISEADFVNRERRAIIPGKYFEQEIAYGIAVFACEYDVFLDYHELFVYLPEEEENTIYMPVKVQSKVSYKKGLFSKTKQCVLYVQPLEDYQEGAIYYQVDGVAEICPILSECLGKEIEITVPVAAEVTLKIADEYVKYYEMA